MIIAVHEHTFCSYYRLRVRFRFIYLIKESRYIVIYIHVSSGIFFVDQETSTKTKQWSLAWRPPTLHYIYITGLQVHIDERDGNSLAVTGYITGYIIMELYIN